MSLFVFLSVLGAALLHASWNALVRIGASKMTGMVIMTALQGAAGLVIALGRPLPEGVVGSGFWPRAFCTRPINFSSPMPMNTAT